MIRNYEDHAANERTFLAWVRTAIALMIFGFVVERFNVEAVAGHALAAGVRFGALAGVGLMLFGLAIVGVATLRFIRTSRAIDEAATHQGPGERLDIALALMLALLGCALVAYVVLSLAGR